MKKYITFVRQLQRYLGYDPNAQRYLQEIKDHIEDKEEDQKFYPQVQPNILDELGEPKYLAAFYNKQKKAHALVSYARIITFLMNTFFLFILYSVIEGLITGVDLLDVHAIPYAAAMAFCVMVSFVAWKWGKTGGVLSIIGGVFLYLSILYSSFAFHLNDDMGFFYYIFGIVMAAPYVIGGMFFLEGTKKQTLNYDRS